MPPPPLRLVEDQVVVPDVIVDLEGNVVPRACPVDLRVLDLHRRDVLDEVGGVTANVDLVAQGERRAQADCGNRATAEVVGHLADRLGRVVSSRHATPPCGEPYTDRGHSNSQSPGTTTLSLPVPSQRTRLGPRWVVTWRRRARTRRRPRRRPRSPPRPILRAHR